MNDRIEIETHFGSENARLRTTTAAINVRNFSHSSIKFSFQYTVSPIANEDLLQRS